MSTINKFLTYEGLEYYDDKIKKYVGAYVAENAPQPDLSAYITSSDITSGATLGTLNIDGQEVAVKGLSEQNGKLQINDLVVDGDLTVKGETITEDTIHNVIEGAVTVVNGGAVESRVTLLGQVILTGYFGGVYGWGSFGEILSSDVEDFIICFELVLLFDSNSCSKC